MKERMRSRPSITRTRGAMPELVIVQFICVKVKRWAWWVGVGGIAVGSGVMIGF